MKLRENILENYRKFQPDEMFQRKKNQTKSLEDILMNISKKSKSGVNISCKKGKKEKKRRKNEEKKKKEKLAKYFYKTP